MVIDRIFKDIEKRARPKNKFEDDGRAYVLSVTLENSACIGNITDAAPDFANRFVELRRTENDVVMVPFDRILYVEVSWQ